MNFETHESRTSRENYLNEFESRLQLEIILTEDDEIAINKFFESMKSQIVNIAKSWLQPRLNDPLNGCIYMVSLSWQDNKHNYTAILCSIYFK